MTSRTIILVALAWGFSTASLAAPENPAQVLERINAIQPAQSDVCKTDGDGTFIEIVTTMASVLPPEGATKLLNKYILPCMKRQVSLIQH